MRVLCLKCGKEHEPVNHSISEVSQLCGKCLRSYWSKPAWNTYIDTYMSKQLPQELPKKEIEEEIESEWDQDINNMHGMSL